MRSMTLTVAAVLLGVTAVSAWAGQGCCAVRPMASDEAAVQAPAAKPQTTCPVMDEPINKAVFADYQGKRVYFCCNMCKATFQKDPEKIIKKLEAEGVTLEKVPAPSE
ncbi:MAG: hypothetical protein V1873_00195 [Verrucomicrobiota bacterium]